MLEKIQQNKRLDLRGYGLNEGVCRSLSKALELNHDMLESVVLASNGAKE